MVQLPAAARLALVNETTPAPAAAERVPLHVVEAPEGVAITKPAGKVSEKATPVNGIAPGLETTNVNVVDAPVATLAGLNDLSSVGKVGTACDSNAPISHTATPLPSPSMGRGKPAPRWSIVSGAPRLFTQPAGSPASMAGLPGSRARVCVGPPLFARGPRLGATLSLLPVALPV